ncbi:MAG: hypothetical protein ACT4P6_22335 [Gemmatimonadaceae bacterium]
MRILSRRILFALTLVAASGASSAAHAQGELGFVSTVFARVHKLSMFVHSLEPTGESILDQSGRGCITLSLCGAGTRVLIALDTRSDRLDLDLGLGAGYLRTVRARTGDSLEIRGAIRALPVLSTQATFMNLGWIRPYVVGSFGLVDLWNGRATNGAGKQTSVTATSFEYGMSLGIGVAPPFTNGRMLLEAGYRARNFASLGYAQPEPLGRQWPRELDLSGWQVSAGWQFDLRTLARTVGFGGSWMLTRVDGAALPTTLRHERSASGAESTRQDIVSAYLELNPRGQTYSLQIVTRTATLSPNGVPQAMRFDDPIRESGTWGYDSKVSVRLTPAAAAQANGAGTSGGSIVRRADEEIVVEHLATGRRLYFRKVKTA